ncbi:MAG: choice-of-anchor D domain-containing protein [Deltaproteobacteria bacterium]|nr:choice-of-anchor D domain-containing protein [Deltaproteobacteria bacterium]
MKLLKLIRQSVALSALLVVFLSGCSGSGNDPAAGVKKQVGLGVSGSAIQVTSGTDNEEQPAIAYDRNANKYLAVWSDYQAGNADVYGKLCDASTPGAGLQATTPVCGAPFAIASGAGNQWQPKVAFDYSSNNYLVVYADTSAGYSRIYGRLVNNAGLPDVAGSFAISEHLDLADPSQIEPEVIYNDFRNTFTVGWLGTSNYDSDDYPAASATTYTTTPTWTSGNTKTLLNANAVTGITLPDGTPVTGYSVSPLNPSATDTTSVITLGSSSNAIGLSSNLTITYANSDVTNNGSTNAGGGAFAANNSFSIAPAGAQTSLALAYFFIDNNRVIPATATTQVRQGIAVSAAVLTGSNLIGLPTAYWTSFQRSTTTWNAPVWQAGSPIIISNVYSLANSAPYSVTITDGNSVNRTADFDITITGNTLLATLKNNGNTLIGANPSVTVQYTPVKNLIGPVVGQGCPNSFGPIAYSPSNHVGTSMVAYRDVAADKTKGAISNYSEAALKENTSGSGSIRYVWTINEKESKPKLAYNPLDGESFMLWSGVQHDETLTIAYAKDSDTGLCNYTATFTKGSDTSQKIVLRRLINNTYFDTQLGSSAFHPALSIDPAAKRMLVAWEEQNSTTFATTGKDVNAQLFDLTNFVSYGNLILASNAVGDQTSPASAFDSVNQSHLLIWEDARNQNANISNIDLYGQFVDPQGNLSGGNVPINVDEGNQLAPALAFGDVDYRQFLIIWKNAVDPANGDLWGQLLQYSTLPQLVIADGSGNPILNGALDFSSVAVGQIKDIPIKLRNDGNTTLTISAMTSPDAPFSFVTPKPVTVSPGTAYDMTIRFSPTAAGSYTGNPSNNFKTSISSNGGNTVLYFSGSGVGTNPLSVTTSALPDAGTAGSYSYQVVAAGGVYPYTWSATGLPAALAISPTTGLISGNNPAAGVYSVTVTVTDSSTPAVSAQRTFTLRVGAVSVTTTELSAWTQGVDYVSSPNHTLSAAGGTGPYTWAVISGALPPGVSLAANGTLSGAPSGSGIYSFTVQATDSGSQTAQTPLSITINPVPTILTTSLANGVLGLAYSQSISMTGGTLPVSWSISGGLPPGLTFNTGSGTISGTATNTGTFTPTISVTDAAGAISSKALSITVNPALDIATPTSGDGSPSKATANTAYSFAFTTNNGGISPYTWSVVNGGLPFGMVVNANTGVLSGTTVVPGDYSFTVQVQDVNGTKVQKTFTVTVTSPLLNTSLVDFGTIATNKASVQVVTLTNTTTTQFNITDIVQPAAPFSVTGAGALPTPASPALILPGASYTFLVTANSAAANSYNSSFTIKTDSPAGNQTVVVKATIVAPSMSIIPAAANPRMTFANVQTNQQATQIIEITNTGILPITITGFSLPANYTSPFKLRDLANGLTVLTSDNYTINQGQKKQFQLVFAPTTAGTFTDKIDIFFDHLPGAPEVFNITASTVPSSMKIIDAATGVATPALTEIDFGSVKAGTAGITKQIKIENDGDQDYYVTTNDMNAPFNITYWWSGLSSWIKAKQSDAYWVDFKPTTRGDFSQTMTVTSDTGVSRSVLVKGKGVAPIMRNLSNNELEFGTLAVGNTLTKSITLYNDGDGQMDIKSLGSLPKGYSFVSTPTTIPAGGQTNIDIKFEPSDAGPFNGSFTVSTDGGDQAIVLGGNGTGPKLTVTASQLDFGSVTQNLSNTLKLTLTNGGSSPLNITGLSNPASTLFKLIYTGNAPTVAAPVTLLPATSYDVYVQFVPTSVGTFLSSFNITSDAINVTGGVQNIALQGFGVPYTIDTNPKGTLTFPSTAVNESQTMNLEVINNGTSPVNLTSIDNPSSPFSIVSLPTLPLSINPGASTTLKVKFAPTSSGPFSSSIGLLFDSSTSPYIVQVTGTAGSQTLSGSLTFNLNNTTVTSALFGSVYEGVTKTLSFTLKNAGSAALNIDTITTPKEGFSTNLFAPLALAAGESKNFSVTFNPTVAKSYSGSLTLKDSTSLVTSQLSLNGVGLNFFAKVTNASGTELTDVVCASLTTQQLTSGNKPAGVTPKSGMQFRVGGLSTTAPETITAEITFDSLPASPVFYKVVNGEWIALTGATLTGNTLKFVITDNGPYDSDPALGSIVDPVVVTSEATSSATTGTTTPPPSSGGGGGGGCFIATAAYGSYLDPHVMVLRHFRDDVLLKSGPGTAFVRFYYHYSPPVADFIAQHDTLRMLMRFALTPLIFAVKYPLLAGLLFALAAAWLLGRRLAGRARRPAEAQAG